MPGGYGTSKRRNAVYFSLVSPLDPNPDLEYKPFLHMKKHHDRLFVIDLEAAQNSLEFKPTANGSVLCYDTVPYEFLTKTDQKVSEKKNTEEESSPTKKSRRDQGQPRTTSWQNIKQETFEPTIITLDIDFADFFFDDLRCARDFSQLSTKRSRFGTVFCRCGKKLGGLTERSSDN